MSNPNKIKNGGEGTRVGNFLRSIDKGELLQNIVSGDFLGALATVVSKKGDLTSEQTKEFNRLYVLDAQDRADARSLQKAALAQDDLFSKRFVYYLAAFWSVVSSIYFFLTTFVEVKNERVSDTILGFLLGTIIGTVINFFFGSSKGSSDKMKEIFKNFKN